MNRARPGFLLFSAMIAVANVALAADESSVGTVVPKENRPAILASPSIDESVHSPSSASRPRMVSPVVAAQLTSVAPKFEALPPVKPEESLPDLRDVDKPRNTIVRLPPYLVPDRKPPPILKERELLTPKARLELALRQYPGLRFGSFWIFSNNGIALAMQAEQERLEQKREFEDLASLMRFSDPVLQAKVKREVDRAFLRQADFGR